MASLRKVAEILWWFYATMCALLVTAGASGYLIVMSISGDNAVVGDVENLQIFVRKVQMGGNLEYTHDVTRFEACPGDVVNTYRAKDDNGQYRNLVITTRRAIVADSQPRTIKEAHIIVGVPRTVTPGRWEFEAGVDSQCPTRHKYDKLVSFDIEVTQ